MKEIKISKNFNHAFAGNKDRLINKISYHMTLLVIEIEIYLNLIIVVYKFLFKVFSARKSG